MDTTLKKVFKNPLWYLLLAVVGTGLFLRLYRFDSIPFGINHDGSLESLEAIEILQHPLPYTPHSAQRPWLGETFFRYYLAGVFKLLGPSPFSAKLATTLLSIATIPIFYLFTKSLLNPKVALFSTAFLSLSGWHIIMGKTVWRASSLPLLETLTFYFLIKAVTRQRPIFSGLAGFCLALTCHTYAAGRITPLLVLCGLVLFFWHQKGKMSHYRKSLLLLLFSFFIGILPLLSFAIKYPRIFNSRTDFLFIGNQIKNSQSLKPLLNNLFKTGVMFNWQAGGDDFFVEEPLLDFPTNIFFLIGLASALLLIKKLEYQLILLGFFINLAPGLLSSPNGNRNIGVLPFVFLLSGIGLEKVCQILKSRLRQRHLYYGFGVLILITTFVNTWRLYFSDQRRELWGFYPETTIVGNFMKPLLDKYDFYLTDNYPRDALTFLTYQGGEPFLKHYQWFEKKEQFLTVQPQGKGIVFVMFKTSENLKFLETLRKKFPSGHSEELKYLSQGGHRPAALLYLVER